MAVGYRAPISRREMQLRLAKRDGYSATFRIAAVFSIGERVRVLPIMIAESCDDRSHPLKRTQIFHVREGKMKKLCVLLTFVFAAGLTVTCPAADAPESADPVVWRNARTGEPVEYENLTSHCLDALSAGSSWVTDYGMAVGCPTGACASGCSCRGSYKFPVPPRFTYHWPGMYSQRCMTSYVSPYRFPPLRPYPGR